MTDPPVTGDEDLLAELEAVIAAVDPPPATLHAAARDALGFGRLTEELAELVATEGLQASGARGADTDRLLTFRAGELEIDVQVAVRTDSLDVTGVLGGADGIDSLSVQTPQTSQEVAVDDHGRFRATGLVGRTLRLELRRTSGATVATSWLLVG